MAGGLAGPLEVLPGEIGKIWKRTGKGRLVIRRLRRNHTQMSAGAETEARDLLRGDAPVRCDDQLIALCGVRRAHDLHFTTSSKRLVGWTLGTIGDAFEAEGFRPDTSYQPNMGGERRSFVEQHYHAIDWTDWDQVRRMLRVIEAVLDRLRDLEDSDAYGNALKAREGIETLLRRDGFEFDEHNTIRPRWEVLTQQSVQGLPDESAIPGHLRRMWEAVELRPEQSISAAKDAIEGTAKHALRVVGAEANVLQRHFGGALR